MKRLVLLRMLLLIGLTGCTAFAGKADYADYKKVRMARDERERLLAMQRYAQRHPGGWFYREVQAERRSRESEVFESGKADRPGLELYLSAFPDGRFAGQARSRLAALKQVDRRRAQERSRAESLLVKRRRQRAELGRTWIGRFARWWIGALAAIDNWGAPLAEVARSHPGFSRAFGSPPRPRCSREECVKRYRSLFAVPVPGGTRIEREVQLFLRLRMREGRLQRAELLLPGRGFSRWYELENQALVVDEDKEDRERAIGWAMDALERMLPGGGADIEPVAGVALAPVEPSALLAAPLEAPETGADTAFAMPEGSGAQGSPQAPAGGERYGAADVFAAESPPETDMVMDTLQVPVEGAPLPAPETAPDLVMEPLQVSPVEGALEPRSGAEAAAGGRQGAGAEGAAPYRVRGFRRGRLRFVLFASNGGQPSPGYDGVVLEVEPAGAEGR